MSKKQTGFQAIGLNNRPRKGGLIQMGEESSGGWGIGVITRAHTEWMPTVRRHKKWLYSTIDREDVLVFELLPETEELSNRASKSDEVWGGLGPLGKNLFMIEAVFPEPIGKRKFVVMVPKPSMVTRWPKKGEKPFFIHQGKRKVTGGAVPITEFEVQVLID